MSTLTTLHTEKQDWSGLDIFLFRTTFIFLLLLTIPLDPGYYQKIFSFNLSNLHFQDFFQLSNYVPRLFATSDWGIASYSGWGVALLVALAGAFIWQRMDTTGKQDNEQLYYWLRVIVRYRLALALIGYGVIKLIPVQLPGATLSDLHTAYGDFLPWKIYYLSTGVAKAGYEQTLGAIEIAAGLLLIWRPTAVIGAGIAAAFLINIVLVNFAYQLGQHVYSVYLLLLAAFILAYDTPRLFQLLVKEGKARADHFEPVFSKNIPPLRYAAKIALAVFVVAYASLTYSSHAKSKWPYPDTPGLSKAYGVYNVKEFTVNKKSLPYSATDTTRWQDVVFERWNVLSIRANKNFPVDTSSPVIEAHADAKRNFDAEGNGGRAFYSYVTDKNKITISNKYIHSDIQVYTFSRPDSSTIVLDGVNSSNDTLHVVLERLNKEYLLFKGRRKPVKVY